MIYFDTSFLTPLVRPEPTSGAVAEFLQRPDISNLTTSQWTRAEFSSLIARDVRMRVTEAVAATRAEVRFEEVLASSFALVMPELEDFGLCKTYLQRYDTRLRAGDALHLAIAANNHAETIYTLDERMLQAGLLLGLPVSRGIALK